MAVKKTKSVTLIDNTINRKYNGHRFTILYNENKVIKPKVKTKIVRKPRDSKPPVWFQKWSDMVFIPFVKEMHEFKNEANARFEKIENVLERNNLK